MLSVGSSPRCFRFTKPNRPHPPRGPTSFLIFSISHPQWKIIFSPLLFSPPPTFSQPQAFAGYSFPAHAFPQSLPLLLTLPALITLFFKCLDLWPAPFVLGILGDGLSIPKGFVFLSPRPAPFLWKAHSHYCVWINSPAQFTPVTPWYCLFLANSSYWLLGMLGCSVFITSDSHTNSTTLISCTKGVQGPCPRL